MSASESTSILPWKIPGSRYTHRVCISCLMTSIFVYHRRITCETVVPSHSFKTSLLIFVWLLLVFWEPLCLPIGIWILHLTHDSKKGKRVEKPT